MSPGIKVLLLQFIILALVATVFGTVKRAGSHIVRIPAPPKPYWGSAIDGNLNSFNRHITLTKLGGLVAVNEYGYEYQIQQSPQLQPSRVKRSAARRNTGNANGRSRDWHRHRHQFRNGMQGHYRHKFASDKRKFHSGQRQRQHQMGGAARRHSRHQFPNWKGGRSRSRANRLDRCAGSNSDKCREHGGFNKYKRN